jgi:hypothetical protein
MMPKHVANSFRYFILCHFPVSLLRHLLATLLIAITGIYMYFVSAVRVRTKRWPSMVRVDWTHKCVAITGNRVGLLVVGSCDGCILAVTSQSEFVLTVRRTTDLSGRKSQRSLDDVMLLFGII